MHEQTPFKKAGIWAGLWYFPALWMVFQVQEFPSMWAASSIFIAEVSAGFVASQFGAFRRLSLWFALAQGFAGGLVFLLFPNPIAVVLGMWVAEHVLAYSILPSLRREPLRTWAAHGLHALASGILCVVILSFFISGAVRASEVDATSGDCNWILERLAPVLSQHEDVTIVIDFDGTAVNTPLFLIQEIIPAVLIGRFMKISYQRQLCFGGNNGVGVPARSVFGKFPRSSTIYGRRGARSARTSENS